MSEEADKAAAARIYREKFGQRLKILRENIGLTVNELAHLLGIEQITFIHKVERGDNRIPPKDVKTWAKALGFDVKKFTRLCLQHYDREMYDNLYQIEHEGNQHILASQQHEGRYKVYYIDANERLNAINWAQHKNFETFDKLFWEWIHSKRMFTESGTISVTGRLELLAQDEKGLKKLSIIAEQRLGYPEDQVDLNMPMRHGTEEEWKRVFKSHEYGPVISDKYFIQQINEQLLGPNETPAVAIVDLTFDQTVRSIKIPRRIDSYWDKPSHKGKYIGDKFDVDTIYISNMSHSIMQTKLETADAYGRYPIYLYWKHFNPKKNWKTVKTVELPPDGMSKAIQKIMENQDMSKGKIEVKNIVKNHKHDLIVQFVSNEGKVLEEVPVDMTDTVKQVRKEVIAAREEAKNELDLFMQARKDIKEMADEFKRESKTIIEKGEKIK